MLTGAMPTMLTMASPPMMVPMMSVAQMELRMRGPAVVAVHSRRVVAVHSRHIVFVLDVHLTRRRLVVVMVLDNATFHDWRVFNHRRPALAVHWTFQVCSTCWLSDEQSQGKG